ncbi:MAG: hypothetical protein IJ530_12685 [Treponema sp.]|uniref:hypothetical protein n=1 Tax=Treponema sp. TaxID=166 RepID=UPI0025E5B60B|nr:hypothetical protein [Treponema sp.]MBQ8680597.1 hypothetical protein [Treponema sp.]
MKTDLPKFIWLCEIYEKNNLSKEVCNGIIILDLTGGNSFSSGSRRASAYREVAKIYLTF